MRRELIWVVIIGIFFGLIVAFGVWRINSSLSSKSKIGFPKASPSSQNTELGFKITLNTPEESSVVNTSPVTISGITKPLIWVVVSGESGDYILQSNEKGIFTQDIVLTAGVNQIKVTAFDPIGDQSIQKVLVVYSSAFKFNTVPTPSTTSNTQNSASTAGDTEIREKVAQKIAEAMNQPKAYLGIVTDITSTTIQIKTPESQIKQVAAEAKEISIINAKGTNNKQVKITDIAIGDFIVAMGYVNGNQVLKAQRILITDALPDSGISVSIGKVVKTSAKSLTIANVKSGESGILSPDKNTTLASFVKGKTSAIKIGGISAGDLVIYVTKASGNSPSVRSVFNLGPASQ